MTMPMTRALYRRSFDDGWLDVLTGLGLVLIGLAWLADQIVLGALVPAALAPFWTIGRRALVEPRLSSPQFGSAQQAETRRALTGWLIFGAGVGLTELAFLIFVNRGGTGLGGVGNVAVGIPAILVGLGLFAGLMLGAKRFAAYGLFAIGLGLAGAWTGTDRPGLLILLSGVLVLACGGALLARFMMRYPMTGDEDA
ncbi:hypothetical protein [Maricaulis sp.]|uniref:hypothetical protein n=1 Tax=Maricaulis sp. TaxID=1486257 RepID=UPI003299CBEC